MKKREESEREKNHWLANHQQNASFFFFRRSYRLFNKDSNVLTRAIQCAQ